MARTVSGLSVGVLFLDNKIQQLYATESRLTSAYTSFSIIAIIIAGIGLVGLTTYLLNRKLKEISVRKVFGSSIAQLIGLIYSGYVKVVLVATLIAWILGYYWMAQWLNGFAYRIELRNVHFIVPTLVMVLILFLATGLQTLKASRTNPIDNLQEE